MDDGSGVPEADGAVGGLIHEAGGDQVEGLHCPDPEPGGGRPGGRSSSSSSNKQRCGAEMADWCWCLGTWADKDRN